MLLVFPHHNFVDAFLHLWSGEGQRIPLGGESEQKTKGRRKRRALVGLGGVDVIRSAANREKTTGRLTVGKNKTKRELDESGVKRRVTEEKDANKSKSKKRNKR